MFRGFTTFLPITRMPESTTVRSLLPVHANFRNKTHSGTSRNSRLGVAVLQTDKIDVASMTKPLPEKHPADVRGFLGRCRIAGADICRSISDPSPAHRAKSRGASCRCLRELTAATPVISLDRTDPTCVGYPFAPRRDTFSELLE